MKKEERRKNMLKREKITYGKMNEKIWKEKNETENMENEKRTSEACFFSRESIMNLFRYRKRRKNVMFYKI